MSPILSINFVARGKKGDPKEIEKLRQDIEDYKAKLKEEFGYQPHQQYWLSLAACFSTSSIQRDMYMKINVYCDEN